MLYVFFFKQKTAYDMRISDWSSDVCSSDLPHRDPSSGESHAPSNNSCLSLRSDLDGGRRLRPGQWASSRQGPRQSDVQGPTDHVRHEDRKSVVMGKSVSVRVDLGCRRIIKIKDIYKETYHRHILQHQ